MSVVHMTAESVWLTIDFQSNSQGSVWLTIDFQGDGQGVCPPAILSLADVTSLIPLNYLANVEGVVIINLVSESFRKKKIFHYQAQT